VPDLGRCAGLAPRPLHMAPQVVRCKSCSNFHKDDGYYYLLTFQYNFTDNVKSRRDIVIDRSVLTYGHRHKFRLLHIIIANEKFMDEFVTAAIKSHVPRPHAGKSSCRLENCHVTVSLILCCLR